MGAPARPRGSNLRITREEIGSFLGLKLETVSRLFSKLQEADLVAVLQKHIRILDAGGLRRLVDPTDTDERLPKRCRAIYTATAA